MESVRFLAVLEFAQPALLAGAAAAVLPFAIHWLLRPRPRRVAFPAVAFLSVALASGHRAQRLRNLWLLVLRALLLACAALLLAGPTCTPASRSADPTQPVACAIVLDDSASTRYRTDEKTTWLDRSRAQADRFLRDCADRPRRSTYVLLSAAPDASPSEWTADASAVLRELRSAREAPPHARALGRALEQAAEMLRSAEQPVRELVVFTDLAAHAWHDVSPTTLAGVEDLAVRVVAPQSGGRSNIGITGVGGAARVYPSGTPIRIDVGVTAGGLDAECWLTARRGGALLARIGPLPVAADTTRELALLLPPLAPGAHALELAVEPDDRLAFDQTYHVAIQTGLRPAVWQLTSAPRRLESDLSSLIFRNLLAPESLESERQAVELRLLSADETSTFAERELESPAADGVRAPNLIVVPSRVDLTARAAAGLQRRVERGATLVLVPGSAVADGDWPGLRALVSAAPLGFEQLPAVTNIRWESEPADADESGLREIESCVIRRRLRLDAPGPGVVVAARYGDGLPAIASRAIGRGRVVVLTTSPDPAWSDLGVRAAGLLSWLHGLAAHTLGLPDRVASLAVGQHSRERLGSLPRRGLARVGLPPGARRSAQWVRLAEGGTTDPWPTEQPGLYTVRAGAGELLYAVNWPAAESDLRPISLARLQALLGTERVELELEREKDAGVDASFLWRVLGSGDAARLVPPLLLALFVSELLLAGRVRGRVGKKQSRAGVSADAGP